jgi:uncharacterized protein (DUF1697 family)
MNRERYLRQLLSVYYGISGSSWASITGSNIRGVVSMATCIAFLRGINVGKAKRIAMADLRALVEGLGCTNVRTLLNSGNVVFDVSRPNVGKLAPAIEAAIQGAAGFTSSVIVMTAADLDAIVRANPLLAVAKDSSRHLVAFVSHSGVLKQARVLLQPSWKPDVIAIGTRAAYLWCANGLIDSRLMKEFARLAGNSVTTRNWATVLKLQALAVDDKKPAVKRPKRKDTRQS